MFDGTSILGYDEVFKHDIARGDGKSTMQMVSLTLLLHRITTKLRVHLLITSKVAALFIFFLSLLFLQKAQRKLSDQGSYLVSYIMPGGIKREKKKQKNCAYRVNALADQSTYYLIIGSKIQLDSIMMLGQEKEKTKSMSNTMTFYHSAAVPFLIDLFE